MNAKPTESTPLNNYKVEAGPLNLVSAIFLFYEKLAPILINLLKVSEGMHGCASIL